MNYRYFYFMNTYDEGIWILEQLPPELQEMILDYVLDTNRSEWMSCIKLCNDEYHLMWHVIYCHDDENRHDIILVRESDRDFETYYEPANYRALDSTAYRPFHTKICNFITSQTGCDLPANY